jgi:hypothetical protein
MSEHIRPAPISYEEVDLSWLVGRKCTEVVLLEPYSWRFFFGKGPQIAIEGGFWRLVVNGRVVRTSGDHGQQFGLPAPVDARQHATALLSDVLVVGVELRQATADLLIEFTGGVGLEIIADSTGYESWELFAPDGRCYVAQGGGQICAWRVDDA